MQTKGVDRLTVVALAILAYAITNVAHEGGGHGGACLLVGGKPLELNAVYFDCDEAHLSAAAIKWVSAGGTLVNLVLGAGAWLGLRLAGGVATKRRYFLWLLMTVSLLQGTGYWLFSGVGNLGDWAKVIEGLAPAWPWRVLLGAVGVAGYILTIRLALRSLAPFVGDDDRIARARTLGLIPYLTGGALYITAGLLNPVSPLLVIISAGAASLGGTSGLAWMHNYLRNGKWFPPVAAPPLEIKRSPLLIAIAAGVALFFIVVLGRTIRLC